MHTYDSIVSEVQPWANSVNLPAARPFEVTFPGQEQTTSTANPFPRRPHEIAMAGQPTTSQAGAAMVQTKPRGETDQLRWLPFSVQAPQTVAIASPAIQTKLTVGQPNDQYEQEADQVAAQVLSMPDQAPGPAVQREAMPEEEEVQAKALTTPAITPLVQREAMPEEEEVQAKAIQRQEAPQEEEELQMKAIQREAMPEEEEVQAKAIQRQEAPQEEEELQMKAIQREAMPEEEVQAKAIQRQEDGQMQAGGNLESQLSSSQGSGSPLPTEVRSFMEPRFGADFSQVRVHTGGASVQMNQDLQAQAFTHQQDIYYGAGKAPGNDALTAHELTHVIQQTGRGREAQDK